MNGISGSRLRAAPFDRFSCANESNAILFRIRLVVSFSADGIRNGKSSSRRKRNALMNEISHFAAK